VEVKIHPFYRFIKYLLAYTTAYTTITSHDHCRPYVTTF